MVSAPAADPLRDAELERLGTVEVARALLDRAAALGRAEVELARREVRGDVRKGILAGGFVGLSGICLVSSLCCALVAAILAIGAALPAVWVAFFGACLFALLGVLGGFTAAAEARSLKPERSLRQAKATAQLVRHPLQGSR